MAANADRTADPLRTRLCEEYGCEIPIVAFALTKEVVAAASNAGAIGVLGISPLEPEDAREQIRWIQDQVGDRPFGVDTLLPASFEEGNPEDLEAMIPDVHRDFVDRLQRDNEIPDPTSPVKAVLGADLLQRVRRQLDVIFDERVPIFASGLGSPAVVLERGHEVGTKVWGLIGMPRQARRELEAGVDLLVAQGGDSGGHSGRIGTFSLVPTVTRMAREYDTPILAAGGVTSGEHIAAALALGAAGVWCGTIWQSTHESDVLPHVKQRLIEAQTEDSVQSRASTGKRASMLRSKWTEAWSEPGAPDPLTMPLQGMLVAKIQQAIDDWEVRDFQTVAAGQGVGLISEQRSVEQVLTDLMSEARDALERAPLRA